MKHRSMDPSTEGTFYNIYYCTINQVISGEAIRSAFFSQFEKCLNPGWTANDSISLYMLIEKLYSSPKYESSWITEENLNNTERNIKRLFRSRIPYYLPIIPQNFVRHDRAITARRVFDGFRYFRVHVLPVFGRSHRNRFSIGLTLHVERAYCHKWCEFYGDKVEELLKTAATIEHLFEFPSVVESDKNEYERIQATLKHVRSEQRYWKEIGNETENYYDNECLMTD